MFGWFDLYIIEGESLNAEDLDFDIINERLLSTMSVTLYGAYTVAAKHCFTDSKTQSISRVW